MSDFSKVLFFTHTDNLRGGGEMSLISLIEAAVKRGYKPYVISPNLGEFTAAAERAGATCEAIRYYYWGRPDSDFESSVNLKAVNSTIDFINQHDIGLVITNTLMVPWGALASAFTNRPHVWIAREFLVEQHTHLEDKYDFINAYSDLLIANSTTNAEYIRQKTHDREVKSFYSYIDSTNLKLGGKSKTGKIVCIATRLYYIKNQLEVLEAAAILKRQNKLPAKILLIGAVDDRTDYYPQLQKFIADNNLKDDVTFADFQEKPFNLVGPEDVIVQPSRNESLGRVMTEAMKLGLICVGADIAGTKEAFQVGGGNLYKSGDPEGLAKLLVDIFEHKNKYKQQAKQAQTRALKNLSENASHQPFFDAIAKLKGQPNSKGELRHIAPLFNAVQYYEAKIEENQQLAKRRQDAIDNILNSRAWKVADKLQNTSKKVNQAKRIFRKGNR